jgi:hypothetical protein
VDLGALTVELGLCSGAAIASRAGLSRREQSIGGMKIMAAVKGISTAISESDSGGAARNYRSLQTTK